MERTYLIVALALLALGAAITAVSGPPLPDTGLETRVHSRAAAPCPR
jgi:hypothetical protein